MDINIGLFSLVFYLIYFIFFAVVCSALYLIFKKKEKIKITLIIVAVWIAFCMFLPGSITFDPGGYEGPLLGWQLILLGPSIIILLNLFENKKWFILGALLILSLYSVVLIGAGIEDDCSHGYNRCMASLLNEPSLCKGNFLCMSQIIRESPETASSIDYPICTTQGKGGINDCYLQLAIAKKDIDGCSKMINTATAEMSEEVKLRAEEIRLDEIKGCQFYVSAKLNDISFCNNLNETSDKDRCYFVFASENSDLSICNKISYMKENCIDIVSNPIIERDDTFARIALILLNIIVLVSIYLILKKSR